MTPEIIFSNHSEQLADHKAKIVALEYNRDVAVKGLEALTEKLDSLKIWMMSTMAAALAGLLAQLLHGK